MTGGAEAENVSARWAELAHDGRHVLLNGFHAVKHAIRFGAALPLIVTSDRAGVLALADQLAPDLAAALRRRLVDVDAATLAQLTGTSHHTKVAALAARSDGPASDALDGAHRVAPAVLLDTPRHLGNVGAVVRVVAGLGGSAVLTTGPTDPWHPDALRGSAGLHFAVPVLRLGPAELDRLAGPVWAIDPQGQDLRKLTVPDEAVLLFGSERCGISAELRERAEVLAALPMRADVSSFNLATSVAMTLYHWAGR